MPAGACRRIPAGAPTTAVTPVRRQISRTAASRASPGTSHWSCSEAAADRSGQRQFREDHEAGTVGIRVLDQTHMLRHVGRDTTLEGLVLDGRYGQRSGHASILGRILSRAVAADGSFPQRLRPRGQALGRADMMEKLRGRQGFEIGL